MANCKQMLMRGGQNAAYQVRDERIDSVKYWLIILVITGHVFLEKGFSDITACAVIWKWIYIFHMPLFIFISGYFSRKKDKKELWSSILKLLEPLIIFHTIAIITKYYFKDTFSFVDILTPWYVLWYLLSLIYWRLIIQIIPNRFLNNTKLILITTFCISILAGFLPFDRFLSLQRTFAFMPFFFLGYCMKRKNIFIHKKYIPICIIFLILIFFIPLLFPKYLGNLYHGDPYYNGIYGVFQRILVFCLAVLMSLSFINICPNNHWIARQGRFTMQYYIYHALIIPPLTVITIKLNIPISFTLAVIYSLFITIGIGIASYIPNFSKFTNPSTFFKK